MSENVQMPPQYSPYYRPQPKKNKWIFPVAIVVGIIFLFIVLMGIFFSMLSAPFEKEMVEVKQNSVLYLTFAGGAAEYEKASPFSFLGDTRNPTLFETLTAIKRAKDDDKIQGIYIKPQLVSPGWAKSQELQEALDDFKTSGKFVYAYIPMGNEMSYYNTLAADSIFMPYEGILEMNGFGVTRLFMKNMFEKIGISFFVSHFEDFKSAGESFEGNKFSDSSKLQLNELLQARHNSFVKSVSEHRDMTIDEINTALARGVYTVDTLLALGFIDAISTESDLKDMIKAKLGIEDESAKLHLINPYDYLNAPGADLKKSYDKDTQIAIIYGSGAINSGRDSDNPFSDEKGIYSGDFIKYLKEARENDKIKAIILRIDSPGGSAFASDEIYREIIKTREIKPVYASMSDYCASGGYYIAVGCDEIITHPLTITGSIGVVSIIPNVSSMLDKLYINADTLGTSPSAFFMNGVYPLTEKDKKQFVDLSRNIYFRFIEKVSKSRNMSFDETRALAKGRVWMGTQAYEKRLADTTGGLLATLAFVKGKLGIPEDQKVKLVQYPKPVDEMTSFMKLFGIDRDKEESSSDLKIAVARALGFSASGFETAINALPDAAKNQIKYFLDLMGMARKEAVLMAMPALADVQ